MSNELTTIQHQPGALADLRHQMMSLPPEHILAGLAEYKERRQTFREWLRAQLIEGTHYGYPPGCEPKRDDRGWFGVWNSKKGGYVYYPPEQWNPKPSFYKAGADFVCDLMGVRDVYDADLEAWQQLGSPAGTFVFACRLLSRATEEVVGEGRGVRKVGQKGGDENNAIKMAKKSAKVDAVLNAYGLSDLFTQDLEDVASPPAHENPSQDQAVPHSASRGDRVTREDCKKLFGKWVDMRTRQQLSADPKEFEDWVEGVTGMDKAHISQAASWTREDLSKCINEIETLIAAYAEPPKAKRGKKGDDLFDQDGGEVYDR